MDLAGTIPLVRISGGLVILFLVPGYLILAPLQARMQFSHVETVCAATGLSLAVIPLSLYVTTLVGLHQSPLFVVILLACATAVLVLISMRTSLRIRWRRHQSSPPQRGLTQAVDSPPAQRHRWLVAGCLAVIFVATLIGRLWSVQGIDYPLWTDSYGHTLIAALVEQQGQVPSDYEPFAPIHDFTYHFGFHTIAVWTHWITGLELPRSVVIAGQVINALVVPTTFLFASCLFRNPYAGLAAALVAGLLSHMPGQFVNWGRYTQLSGQILLPVALVFWLELLRSRNHNRLAFAILTVLSFSGLFIVHYRIFLFAALMALPALLFALFAPQDQASQSAARYWQAPSAVFSSTPAVRQERRSRQNNRVWIMIYAVSIGVVTLILLAPWIGRLFGGFGAQFAQEVAGGYDAQDHGEYFDFNIRYILDFGVHAYLLALATITAVWGMIIRNREVLLLMLWCLLLAVTANLHLVGVTPFYSTTIVILFLYFPVSVLIGYLTDRMIHFFAIGKRLHRPRQPNWLTARIPAIGLVVLLVAGVYGIQRDLELIAPENGFVRTQDVQAMAWIRHNIQNDALFYIATSFWTPRVAHGLDGGYWLPLLAERQTIMPPQKYASDGEPAYTDYINQRLRSLKAATFPEEFWQKLNEFGVTHIYIGARKTGIDPDRFLAYPDQFMPLYSQDDVWIFAVVHS